MKKTLVTICLLAGILMVQGCVHKETDEENAAKRLAQEAGLKKALAPYFNSIPTIQWTVFDNNKVYVGFRVNYNSSSLTSIKIIMRNAALLAGMEGYLGFELWAVDATRTSKNWTPENGIEAWLLTQVFQNGNIIQTQ
jgi:hypothetical protein